MKTISTVLCLIVLAAIDARGDAASGRAACAASTVSSRGASTCSSHA